METEWRNSDDCQGLDEEEIGKLVLKGTVSEKMKKIFRNVGQISNCQGLGRARFGGREGSMIIKEQD